MKLRDIAVNNLRRRKTKVFFLIAGLLVGVAAVVALVTTTQTLEEDMAHKMDEFGANIIITPKSEGLSLTYGGLSLGGLSFDLREISEADLAKIKQIPNAANIRIVSPKVFGVFENKEHKALVVGVDFPEELALKKWWRITGSSPADEGEVLIGKELADRFGLKAGASIDVKGETFKVSGVIEPTGSQDDNLLFMAIGQAQKLFDKQGKVGMVEVAALCKNCPISELVNQLSEKIPSAKVTAIQQVVEGRMDALHGFRKFSLGISGLVLLVGAMVVFVTMTASVNERTREIGIFSAIGFRRSHIMRIILLEALLVSAAAGIVGYLIGMGATRVVLGVLSDHSAHMVWNPLIPVGAVFLSVIIGILSSLYPALSAARMDPSEALRTL